MPEYEVKIIGVFRVEAKTEKKAVEEAYSRYYEFKHDTWEEVKVIDPKCPCTHYKECNGDCNGGDCPECVKKGKRGFMQWEQKTDVGPDGHLIDRGGRSVCRDCGYVEREVKK